MPRNPELTSAIERLQKHAAAISGEKSAAAFSASPYFSRLPGDCWSWATDELNADRSLLVNAVISGQLSEEAARD
jgi:hypothetical protein